MEFWISWTSMPVTTGVALGVKGLAIGVFAWQGHIIISQLFIAYYNLAHCFISRYLCDQGSSAMGYCIHLQPLSTSFFNLTTVSLFLQWATIERLMMFSVIFVIIWTSAWKFVLYIHLWCWYWLWLMRHDSAMNQKTDFYSRVLMFDYVLAIQGLYMYFSHEPHYHKLPYSANLNSQRELYSKTIIQTKTTYNVT